MYRFSTDETIINFTIENLKMNTEAVGRMPIDSMLLNTEKERKA
jgi:hypothetical protein